MSEQLLESGLIVTDRRHDRSLSPNGNEPSTVGPDHRSPGHVMYPAGHELAERWDGWPVEWNPPPWGEAWSGTGYGRQGMFGKVSTAMTCVDLNSRQLASFPTYGVKDQTPFTLPSWSSNPEPSLYSGWSDFMHGVVNCLMLRGEAFQYATGRYASESPGTPGRVARFVNVNPDSVGVEWIDGRIEYLIDGQPVDPADICHIKAQSYPGLLRGISPIEWIGQSLATASSLEGYARGLATRGGIPWAVLKSRSNIDRTQAETLQDRWVSAAARRDGAPGVLGGDLDLIPLTLSPRDMALLELREFDERRICAAFGVPSYLVNVEQTNSMTYANSTDLRIFHWQATLRPLSQTIAEPWSNWLLARGSRMEFNPDRYIQPPLAERVQWYQALYNMVDPVSGERAMTIAEIRAAERLAPLGVQSSEELAAAEFLTGART